MTFFGGIEAGGTKFVCVVVDENQNIISEARFPTTTPAEVFLQVTQFFTEQNHMLDQPIAAMGIGSFGPLDPEPNSANYGYITTTPKPGWLNTPIVKPLEDEFGVPVAFDTDVNAAALAEGLWGAAKGLDNFLYLTIGTGIGGGGIFNGKPLHGLIHPEMGHVRIPHDWTRDPYSGFCPFHGDCLEGLAAGPALLKRWGQPAETLPDDHNAWALEAHYIALALHNLICSFSPTKIILGGGVMQQTHLFPLVRTETIRQLNGYIHSGAILDAIDDYIAPPGLGTRSGVLGAIALAQQVYRAKKNSEITIDL